MAIPAPRHPSFVIRIIDTQDDTWQGELTWVDTGERLPFRSLLEMIRLMDRAIQTSAQDE